MVISVALTASLVLAPLSVAAQPPRSEPPTVQIIAPADSFKLRAGRDAEIRVRVEPAAALLQEWTLRIVGSDHAEVELAQGTDPVPDQAVARLSAASLEAGSTYTLVLRARDANGAASEARSSLRVPDPQYTLIPLEAGNLSSSRLGILSLDASGTLTAFGGMPGEPNEISLVSPTNGTATAIRIPGGLTTEGAKLSPDGKRFFFVGSFRRSDGTGSLGLGFIDLASLTPTLVAEQASSFFSVDQTGRRVAFQAPAGPRGNRGPMRQYFLYDEEMLDFRQLTDSPDAIIFTSDAAACPRTLGTTPLLSSDGASLVLITGNTLGLLQPDPSLGCHIFAYDVASSTLRHIRSLPRAISLDIPVVSEDERFLSFVSSRPSPISSRQAFPALVDLQNGELTDPVGDIFDFPSFDSAVSGDGRHIIVSTQADVDPRVGNADHTMDLFLYDLAARSFTQISETTAGIGRFPNGCPSYRPRVNRDASMIAFAFNIVSAEMCHLDGPQRNEADGFVFRFVRAVRKRVGNRGPELAPLADTRVVAGQTLTLSLSATDPDGDPITFFAQVPGGMDVPPGSDIEDQHNGTATFRWPTKPENAGVHSLRVAAFDEGGGEVFHDFTITVAPAGTERPACTGDCDENGQVTIEELVRAVNLVLESMPMSSCARADRDANGRVTIDELVAATRHALDGCAT